MAGATPTPAEVDVAKIFAHSLHMVMSHHHNRNILQKFYKLFDFIKI
jgi:hypothetical protein